MKARLQHRYRRARRWFGQPGGRGDIVAALGVFALLVGVAFLVAERDRQADRVTDRAETRERVDRIGYRLVRVERRDPGLCRRSAPCRAVQRREAAARRRAQRETPAPRRQRRDDEQRAPDQRADRPPRATAQPPSTPTPTPPGGDPPDPPSTSTPVTPTTPGPAAPSRGPTVRVDPPAVDLDGDQGLLPELLPDVNLPPVKLPAVEVRLDELPRVGR